MEGDKLRYSCVGGGNEGSKKCIVEGVTYENGQKFSIPGRSKCFMYQCANGKANTIQEGCEVDGECRDVGSTFLRNPCDTYKCIKEVKEDANYFKASIINRRCEDSNGKCHSPGDVFSKRIGSVVYNNCSCTLEQKHTKYRCYAPDTDGQPKDCDIGGITYPDGKMFALPGQSMCLKYLCTKGVVSVAQEACEVDGACVPLNSISDDGCSKFKCIKEDGNEGLTYRSEQSEIMCRDVYGNSQPLCTEFYHGIKGKHYPNCTCTLNETGQIDYSCVDAKCEVDGRNYGHGERFVVSTRSHCVKYLCWHGGWDISQGACEINGDCYPADAEFQIDCKQYKCATVQKNGIDFFEAQLIGDRDECQDKDGTCQSPGEVFSKVVDSKTYTKCTCKVELDHSFYHCTSANGENEPRDCVVDGNTHKDGAVFTLNGQSPCLKFRCSDGDVDIDEEGCEHKGECKPVGSQVEENCERSKCLKERGLARWVTSKFLPCNTEGSD
ncbi:uncharacterized protein LOC101853851 [Aplysia californica]|uniref:Uncharacterized protein LOC101853851 n=1 Tax=Aplysia californica TaxID=6500 RepID=A0ABM0ZZ87_APLCA|nr:uncharacterized protein LOC101853851 [Aplysia californica]